MLHPPDLKFHDPMNPEPIGVFDSGVGGLSVLRAIREQLPGESVLYLADQGHVPYGPRPMNEVRRFSEGIVRYLLGQRSKLIVVACNAASAAALQHLRQVFPEAPFVGMEPAVKPAAEGTLSGVVGILATPATFQGALYASVVERFASNVEIMQETCPGLVGLVEKGELETPGTRKILEQALLPMLRRGVDTIVLGCTHYPFVIPIIKKIAGEGVRVIDPAPAIARQVIRMLDAAGLRADRETGGTIRYHTTGDPEVFSVVLPRLFDATGEIIGMVWDGDILREG